MAKKEKSGANWLIMGFIVLMIGLMSVLLVSFFWWQQMIKPVQIGSGEVVRFVVGKGSGVSAIADNLEEENLIRSALVFKLMVKKLGLEKDIQAGSFELSPGQNMEEIAASFTKGTSDLWVTVLEGLRNEEVARAVAEAFTDRGQDFDELAFLKLIQEDEGYLFPDTYLVPLEMDEAGMAKLLSNTHDQKVTDEMKVDAKKAGRTMDEIMIMASLIEREAKLDKSRKMISGILWNRLDNDWPLQVDATLQYSLGYDEVKDDWWVPPLAADKEVKSPYNTYANPGLPPAPIANPSLSSIKAAIYPTDSDYWYYLTDPEGNMRYGVTLDDHNRNIQQYLR